MENFETGLLLMVVGMTTVFAILLLVIFIGKGLITLVNKYAPEEITAKKTGLTSAAKNIAEKVGNLSGQETAAIISAVSMVTGGQGKVIKIEKI